MKRFDILAVIFLLITFIGYLFLFHKETLTYTFDETLIERYFRSQDIEDIEDKIENRIFLSDSELYISAGYLYAKGADPADFNFQHPPFVKYLFGFSTALLGNPFFVQIVFAGAYLVLTYILGVKVFNSRLVALVASSLLLFDPVFSGMLSEALLDLGQAAFSLAYVAVSLFAPASFILHGVVLGLFAASKFWTATLFFIAILLLYKLISKKEKIYIKGILISFAVAFLVFSLTYLRTFIENEGVFNIVFWQAKTLKFMLDHNAAKVVGGPAILFLSGHFSDWWGENLTRITDWSILWPIAFLNSFYLTVKSKKIDGKFVVYLLPILYLLYLSAQVPFSRYFIVVLPYFYLGLGVTLEKLSRRFIPGQKRPR